METLRNYLETMFANLPNSLEVNNAKNELWTMMEDKYNELIAEGKTENEAVGTIIAEFGNLDEISEAIGLKTVMEEYEETVVRKVTLQDAKDYVVDVSRRQFLIAVAVFLFIASPVGPIIGGVIGGFSLFKALSGLFVAAGIVFLFLAVAIGVGIIIVSGIPMQEWDFLHKEPCGIDFATTEYIAQEKKNNETERSLMIAIGVICCIVSVIPVSFFGALGISEFLTAAIGPSLVLAITGIGVMLIIASNGKNKAYNRLLRLNDEKTVAGNYESAKKNVEIYRDKNVNYIMDNYWRIITCVYLIWSFISFDWHKTWIIFPIAALLRGFIKNNCQEKDGGKK